MPQAKLVRGAAPPPPLPKSPVYSCAGQRREFHSSTNSRNIPRFCSVLCSLQRGGGGGAAREQNGGGEVSGGKQRGAESAWAGLAGRLRGGTRQGHQAPAEPSPACKRCHCFGLPLQRLAAAGPCRSPPPPCAPCPEPGLPEELAAALTQPPGELWVLGEVVVSGDGLHWTLVRRPRRLGRPSRRRRRCRRLGVARFELWGRGRGVGGRQREAGREAAGGWLWVNPLGREGHPASRQRPAPLRPAQPRRPEALAVVTHAAAAAAAAAAQPDAAPGAQPCPAAPAPSAPSPHSASGSAWPP